MDKVLVDEDNHLREVVDMCMPEPTYDTISCDFGNQVLCKAREFSINLIDNGELVVHMWRLDGTLIKFNNLAQKKTGYSEEEVLGRRWINTIIPEDHLPGLNEMFSAIKSGIIPPIKECQVYCKDGRQLDIIWSNYIMRNANGEPYLAVSVGMDITELKSNSKRLTTSYEELQTVHDKLELIQKQLQKQLEEQSSIQQSLIESEERYRLVLEGSNDGIWDLDIANNKNYFFSDRCFEMAGYRREDTNVGYNSWIELVHPEDYERVSNHIIAYLNKEVSSYNIEFRIRKKSGEYIWVLSTGMALWDENDNPIRFAGSTTSIEERKRAEEEIYKIAYYDELTGLPNRAALLKELYLELSVAKQRNNKLALLSLDIDNFKNINDSLGHNNGDELLRIIGRKVGSFKSKYISIARGGGDEFLVLIKNAEDRDTIKDICSSLIQIFRQPININNIELNAAVSIGGALYPEDGQDEYALLKNADIAMYNVKEQGGNKFELFNNEMNVRIIEKLELESGLNNALKNNEFCIYYQPQIDIISNEIVGLEALIRWQHPIKGLIPPFKFIPIAEETGLIIQIGEWVLRNACKQFIEWKKNNIEPSRIAVNISAKQFEQSNFVSVVKSVIEETGIDPKYIELEITESIAAKNLDYTIKVINELKKLSIKVSLDDFGTGYSSLNYLMRLPINTLKIDKSFLDNITLNSNEELIAKTIITLAKNMKLDVIAEGVETIEQLRFLKEQSCDIAQGYLFSRPIPESEVKELLVSKTINI